MQSSANHMLKMPFFLLCFSKLVVQRLTWPLLVGFLNFRVIVALELRSKYVDPNPVCATVIQENLRGRISLY